MGRILNALPKARGQIEAFICPRRLPQCDLSWPSQTCSLHASLEEVEMGEPFVLSRIGACPLDYNVSSESRQTHIREGESVGRLNEAMRIEGE